MAHTLLGTPLPDDLAAEAERVSDLLRSDAARDEKADAVDALVYRFVQTGIDVHFHGPARLLGLNAVLVKVIDVAAGVTLRALKTATRRVLRSVSDAQFHEIADEIEDRLYELEG